MRNFKNMILILILVLIDFLIKVSIMSFVELNEVNVIIKDFFSITYVKNYGAAFSILSNKSFFIIIVSLCILIYLIKELLNNKNKYLNYIYIIIISGLLGNLIDRLFRGYVVDYLSFEIFNYDFAIFNFADVLIVCGATIYILFELKKGDLKNG